MQYTALASKSVSLILNASINSMAFNYKVLIQCYFKGCYKYSAFYQVIYYHTFPQVVTFNHLTIAVCVHASYVHLVTVFHVYFIIIWYQIHFRLYLWGSGDFSHFQIFLVISYIL